MDKYRPCLPERQESRCFTQIPVPCTAALTRAQADRSAQHHPSFASHGSPSGPKPPQRVCAGARACPEPDQSLSPSPAPAPTPGRAGNALRARLPGLPSTQTGPHTHRNAQPAPLGTAKHHNSIIPKELWHLPLHLCPFPVAAARTGLSERAFPSQFIPAQRRRGACP